MSMELRPEGISPSASVDLYVAATKVATFKEDGTADLPYNNSTSGLVATTVDAAIDEVVGQQFGVGQVLRNVTSSRVSGITYPNTTGKLILVIVSTNSTTNIQLDGYVDGGLIESYGYNGTAGLSFLILPVPAGSDYSVVRSGVGSINRWTELTI